MTLAFLDQRARLLVQCTAESPDDSWLSQTQKEGDKWQNPTTAQHHENSEKLIQRKEELMLCLEFEEKGLSQISK